MVDNDALPVTFGGKQQMSNKQKRSSTPWANTQSIPTLERSQQWAHRVSDTRLCRKEPRNCKSTTALAEKEKTDRAQLVVVLHSNLTKMARHARLDCKEGTPTGNTTLFVGMTKEQEGSPRQHWKQTQLETLFSCAMSRGAATLFAPPGCCDCFFPHLPVSFEFVWRFACLNASDFRGIENLTLSLFFLLPPLKSLSRQFSENWKIEVRFCGKVWKIDQMFLPLSRLLLFFGSFQSL